MDFIPLCFTFGCPTKYSSEGDGQARWCPRCNNAAMFPQKATKCFEFCFVPLIPCGSDHVYRCNICSCEVDQSSPLQIANGPPPNSGYHMQGQGYYPQGGYPQQQQQQQGPPPQGYNPGYYSK